MKIFTGINASPRKGGNTHLLLESFLKGADRQGAETKQIILADLDYTPCLECEDLTNNRRCIIKDDLQKIYDIVEDCDVLAFASPIFFGSLSAQAKMFIDRFQCHWRAKEILKLKSQLKRKQGVFLCVEASERNDFLLNAKSIAKNFFATVNAEYSAEVFCKGVDVKKAILGRPEALDKARRLGGEMAGK